MTVWVVVTWPDYDNYDFDLYVSRDAALVAIKASVGNAAGEWSETHGGEQIEFDEVTPKRRLPRGKRVWSMEEQEVHG